MRKTIVKIIVPIGFIILLLIPILIMFRLSESETQKYIQNKEYIFKESSFGSLKEVTRSDLEQYYTFSGTVISDTYEYVEFTGYGQDVNIKPMVNIGDEVQKGDLVAYAGYYELRAKNDGIIEEIMPTYDGNIKIKIFENLKLSCFADKKLIDNIRDKKDLTTQDGKKVTIDFISNVMNLENKIEIIFDIKDNDYNYGQTIENVNIYTGEIYKNVLVIDKDCVYQKRQDGPYYVREVDFNTLFFILEHEVQIGFETEQYYSVTNIQEGMWCDSGYKELVEVSDQTYG